MDLMRRRSKRSVLDLMRRMKIKLMVRYGQRSIRMSETGGGLRSRTTENYSDSLRVSGLIIGLFMSITSFPHNNLNKITEIVVTDHVRCCVMANNRLCVLKIVHVCVLLIHNDVLYNANA